MKRLVPFLLLLSAATALASDIPESFVEIREVIPDVLMDIRYVTEHNFVGAKVEGYEAAKCYLTRKAAEALSGVEADLRPFGFGLKIYDCYRPQRAVNHFVRWAEDLNDTKTRTEFYPTVDKRHLFRDGYIASRSGHSRGSTVDLTLVALPPKPQPSFILGKTEQKACFLPIEERFRDNGLDMGTGFDCFHELSHPENPALSEQQRAYRLLLKTLMEKHGFRYYDKEWWHFTLKNEPFPDTYFDFVVK
ncbi:M15 family metallopeptidase [Desulfobotulus sp.]|jgi:D-alanyl-D-alanine dipeptidase|uniref:M15 family metallopeptidase n=1 Tax=Desulfobotulus sp. TaxID=1940337 RepID=UPI002A36CE58|nr:M15 family metallopeptidase [Desulfobotulus sp.]MDY0162469.1 M15 family metallopeptidase [Desulfobotulus sp.]